MADIGGSHPARSNVCHRCDRRFSRLEHLQRHERSHTKEKPYKCVHCPKAFTRKDLLTRHLRISHPVTPPEVSSLENDGHLRVEHDDSDASSPTAARTADSPDAPQLTPAELTDPGNAASGAFFPPPDAEPSGFDFDGTAPPSLIQGYYLDSGSLGHTPDPAFTHDFASFLDAVPGLDQFSAEIYQPLPIFSSDFLVGPPESMEPQNGAGNVARDLELGVSTASQRPLEAEPNNGAASSLSRYGSRLPSLQPEDRPPPSRPRGSNLIVTNEIRQRLVDELSTLPTSTSHGVDLILPSRHALTRFIGGYFKNFHNHYPFIHVPTLNMGSISIELFLAMAALGARYTQEPELAMELFHAARSITLERVQRAQGHPRWRHGTDAAATVNTGNGTSLPDINRTLDLVETMQALVLLVANSSFHKHEPGAAGALSMRSLLHSLALDESIVRSQMEPPGDWESWIKFESIKRTQLVVFSFFSIHTILFDLPPMMLVSDVDLPSSEREWSAVTEEEWRQCRDRYGTTRHDFQAAFADLFYGDDAAFEASEGPAFNLSTLGGCGIIHALIQQIWLARNARFPKSRQDHGGLSTEEMRTFEHALKRWAVCWERNQESSMDPLSPYGPVAFNSVALLRLAYIRLNMDLGPVRSLGSWDPALVARSIHNSPAGGRGKRLARAALHAAHALSIPVKLGINYVTRTQIMQWSNQYAICSLECAILLAKWLESVTAPDVAPPLTTAETRVLEFVVDLVVEAEYKSSRRQVLEEGGRLNAKIVRLWARLYQSESVWQMVNIIGETLHLYADLLEGASR